MALLLLAGVVVLAQKYPSEWIKYTSDGYFHNIESASTKQRALDLAYANLARQIQVKVDEVSQMDKQAVNGRSSVLYRSSTSFSTNMNMKLSETKSYYNEASEQYYVLAYIDKAASCSYYEKDVKMLITKLDNVVAIADNYVNNGFKQKAKAELQKASQMLEDAGEPFLWLNVFGFNENRLQNYLSQMNEREQSIKQKLADHEYGITYCVVCEADLFGKRYVKLQNEVKGDLAAFGCNFVDDSTKADVVIHIKASARKYNEFQGAYFTYIDAAMTIDKNATGQRIFEDELSTKGAHTLSYDEAARDGYKQIKKEIVKRLKENIKL